MWRGLRRVRTNTERFSHNIWCPGRYPKWSPHKYR